MIAGRRQSMVGNHNYHADPLYGYAKAFTEAAEEILNESNLDLFTEPQKAMRNRSTKEALKSFFCENFIDEADETKTAEELEDEKHDVEEMFENDMEAMRGLNESAFMSDYSPMVGMALPIHKLILMNNVFSQGGGIQKVVAVQPNFTISMERRLIVTPDGKEIDMFLDQNKITDAIDASAPVKTIELAVPEKGTTDILTQIGATDKDELSSTTAVVGIKVAGVHYEIGDHLPDAEGYYTTKGTNVANAPEDKDTWFRVNIPFTPNYGGPNRFERTFATPVNITYKSNGTGSVTTETLSDTLFGTMDNNKIVLQSVTGKITSVRLAAKINTSSANMELASVKWKVDTDYVEIPEATPINTTISPEETKDIAAMYDANQVTKIMSITKTALSEYKDMKIKRQLDASYARMDERTSFYDQFDFAVPSGYDLDWVTFRQATFMDFFDDYVTKMLYVLNDPNMTVTVYGDPRIVRKVTPTEYTYAAPANIGPVTLDYNKTIVDTKDNRIYNFVGSDKLRNTNQLIIVLNPRNSERICYRIYDYQFYMSNEIRNAANPSLPAIHAFERWLMKEYQPVQGRIDILNPTGRK